jgi:asparagine N-glycosylation enzyme membrane subunit Stt3
MALLMGYLGWQILQFIVSKTFSPVPVAAAAPRTIKKKKSREIEPRRVRGGFMARNRVVVIAITAIAVFFLIVFPEISPAVAAATLTPNNAPSDDWHKALNWLKNNTPEPLGDSAAYYNYYSQPVSYPDSAYGIAAWWDYGYLVMRIGHRLPVCDPGAGAREQVAKLLTAQNEDVANGIMDQLNTQYVIIDNKTVTTKFHGVAAYAGLELADFNEVYYANTSGKYTPGVYYYPEYFQSLAARLYIFNGGKVTPSSVKVITYENKLTQEDIAYKVIVNTNTFSTYQEATDFMAKQKTGNYKIVSNSPSTPSVPLERFPHYKLVYPVSPADSSTVKIFEYIK